MDVEYLDNRGKGVGTAIELASESATQISAAVAYATDRGIRRLEEGMQLVAGRGGRTRLLTGLDDYLTDTTAVERVSALAGTECRVFLPKGAGEGGRFHPKLYLFDGERESSVIVGSANLTGEGLGGNHEAAVWLRGDPDEPLLDQVRESFTLLWTSPRAVALSPTLRDRYEAARRARDAALAQVVGLDEFRRLTRAVGEHAARALVRGGSRRWLMITSPSNFDICLRLSRWGDERSGRIGQVQPGDAIIFYITGEHSLGAVAVAVGPARPSIERPWPDRPYPYQMDIAFLAVATPRPSIRPLIDQLDLFEGAGRTWGQRLQTTLREISERDFGLLEAAVGSMSQVPESRAIRSS